MAEFSAKVFTEPQMTTGIHRAVSRFLSAEERAALAPGESAPQEVDDEGRPLVEVECIRTVVRFGNPATEVFSVRLPDAREVQALVPGQVSFSGLRVGVYANKAGRLVERWAADSLLQNQPTVMTDTTSPSAMVNSFGAEDGEDDE